MRGGGTFSTCAFSPITLAPFKPDVVPVEATNVAQWVWPKSDMSLLDIAASAGALVPPFPRMLIEFNHPHFDDIPQDQVAASRTGVYLKTEEHEEWGWKIRSLSFARFENRKDIVVYPMEYVWILDENGNLDGASTPEPGYKYPEVYYDYLKRVADAQEMPLADVAAPYQIGTFESGIIALTTCGFINCKNIDLELEPERHTTKAKRRKYGDPVRYYHIKLPLAPGRRSDGRRNVDDGGAVPIHIVRGHFKTYTDENPLFGKVTGTWWWGHHARCDEKNGVSIHDYEVTPGGK